MKLLMHAEPMDAAVLTSCIFAAGLSLHPCSLPQVKDTLQPPYQIAAQNSWVKGTGAYTGEIAPELLVDLGIG
jgi:triosephosphate isomerase